MSTPDPKRDERIEQSTGPLVWMAKNSVAANLLMFLILIGGGILLLNIKKEVFPEFDLDIVIVNVPYPGASPAEVEQGVLMAIEEEVRGIDGVKEVRSTANESVGVVTVELLLGTNTERALSDVKAAVDRIQSFPEEAERPIVSLASARREVIKLVIYGDVSERTLRKLAESARDELLADERVTFAELDAVRDYEISVEVPQKELRAHGLTLEEIAGRIRQASIELPSGGVKTAAGEVLLRTTERRDEADEIRSIAMLSQRDGREVPIGSFADVKDDFQDTDQESYYNGQPAALVNVFRVGDETPIEVAQAVRDYIARVEPTMPAKISMTTWFDMSEMYAERVDLLQRNAIIGLILVMLTLALFLQPRLAFWVTLGIPISFVGSLVILPMFGGVSINMISLFAFIVTLGIVVDDAIVVGEAIYTKIEAGYRPMAAAIAGVKEVAVPVTFAVLTTIVAFAPLLIVPGMMGKFFRQIPTVVIAVLVLSLVESLIILPAHLAHHGLVHNILGKVLGWMTSAHERMGGALTHFIRQRYAPFLTKAIESRYLTLTAAIAVFLATIGLVAGGRIEVTPMPKIDSDLIVATVKMPFGTPAAQTKKVTEELLAIANATSRRLESNPARGVFSQVGGLAAGFGPPRGDGNPTGSHLGQVSVYLVPSDQREITARDYTNLWRESVGDIAGVDSLTFRYSTGPGAQAAINIELSHPDLGVLEDASAVVAASLADFKGVTDIDDGFQPGKQQLDLKLKPEARILGMTETSMARQLRGSFFGIEATRQQRGRDEVRTYVRLPKSERLSEYNIEQLLLRTPAGGEIPLGRAANIDRGRAYTTIRRMDGRRIVQVTANVVEGVANAQVVTPAVIDKVMPGLTKKFPLLRYDLAGEQKQWADSMKALGMGFIVALFMIYALLAVVFRSYIQPAIIMIAIPFGLVGAFLGHLIMGYSLSMISFMGVVALSGIVVNDSLILIVATNRYRAKGMSAAEAVRAGAVRRFRPILLTSLTTFFGLVPMILEPSMQARFLIPMALSLGFGVLVATVWILVLVPAVYKIVDDIKTMVVGSDAPVLPGSQSESGAPAAK